MATARKSYLLLAVFITASAILGYIMISSSPSGVVRGTLSPLGRGVMSSFYSEALYQGVKLPEAYIVHEMLYQPASQVPVVSHPAPEAGIVYVIAGIVSSFMLSEVIERSVR